MSRANPSTTHDNAGIAANRDLLPTGATIDQFDALLSSRRDGSRHLESGGIIEPLSADRTVIVIERGPVQQEMRHQLREWGSRLDTRDAMDDVIDVAWVTAYNEREASRA